MYIIIQYMYMYIQYMYMYIHVYYTIMCISFFPLHVLCVCRLHSCLLSSNLPQATPHLLNLLNKGEEGRGLFPRQQWGPSSVPLCVD